MKLADGIWRPLCHRAIAPVFVIGSYRSGTSVTTWALGQHPNIFALEETHFLYKLAVDLDYLFQIGSRMGDYSFLGMARMRRREFYEYFGGCCDRLIRQSKRRIFEHANSEKFRTKRTPNIKLRRRFWHPKRRWVDGTPENSHFVYPLLRLFPNAKFIHILRNPKLVATSLMHFSTAGGIDYGEEDAYRLWARMARNCALAELAFGPKRIMRIHYDDIVREPKETIKRCLAFVGESFHPDCVLPFNERVNSSRYGSVGDISIEANLESPKSYVRESFLLYQSLLTGEVPGVNSRLQALRELRRMFQEYAASLRPDTNEWLSQECLRLTDENNELRKQVTILERRLKPFVAPLQIVDFGPREVILGQPFNVQPSGESAIWVRVKNADDAVIELGHERLRTAIDEGGTLLTAAVPAVLLQKAGELPLFVENRRSGERVGPETIQVIDPHSG
jgi:hypothetical protein